MQSNTEPRVFILWDTQIPAYLAVALAENYRPDDRLLLRDRFTDNCVFPSRGLIEIAPAEVAKSVLSIPEKKRPKGTGQNGRGLTWAHHVLRSPDGTDTGLMQRVAILLVLHKLDFNYREIFWIASSTDEPLTTLAQALMPELKLKFITQRNPGDG